MATEAAEALMNATYEERCAWITKKKDEGNQLFKSNKLEEAIDAYMACLCGFDFKKAGATKQQQKDANTNLKVPVLNNMALCLMN